MLVILVLLVKVCFLCIQAYTVETIKTFTNFLTSLLLNLAKDNIFIEHIKKNYKLLVKFILQLLKLVIGIQRNFTIKHHPLKQKNYY